MHSAAVAFLLTLLSKLLEHATRILVESPLSPNSQPPGLNGDHSTLSKGSAESGKTGGTTDADDDIARKKKKLLMLKLRRRRRRRGASTEESEDSDTDTRGRHAALSSDEENESDLSEGILTGSFL